MRKAPAAQLGSDGRPSGAPGSCLPLPAKLPAREYSMNFPPSAYSGDAALLAFLGSASLGELAERLGREAGCDVAYSVFSSGEDEDGEEGEESSSSEEAAAAAGTAGAYVRSRPYIGVETRIGGKFVASLTHGGVSYRLGDFESAEAAACVRDVGAVWRQLRKDGERRAGLWGGCVRMWVHACVWRLPQCMSAAALCWEILHCRLLRWGGPICSAPAGLSWVLAAPCRYPCSQGQLLRPGAALAIAAGSAHRCWFACLLQSRSPRPPSTCHS